MSNTTRQQHEHSELPQFIKWNLATPQSGLRVFQGIGSLVSLCLIGSVGSQFSPTYASLMVCTIVSIISPMLVIIFSFNLHNTTKSIDWILWEIIYCGSGAFLFFVNSITMSYSSLRWQHTLWYFAALFCILVCISFVLDVYMSARILQGNPKARDSLQRKEPVVYSE
ncbi:unnamed protein product [Auanema sp. JU1783]|nr:unnamed protein product [Auanema sp. JU1783]